jgi:hypothetical protein
LFTWFRKGAEYLHYEARKIAERRYELTVVNMDGTSTVEQFSSEDALQARQVALQQELEASGWTGPHGWNI